MGIVKKDKFEKKFRYHHGNLRQTLVEAALEILKEQGIESLSLRAIAKKTNVSQAAPYSHFRDKNDLLAAVAESGFQSLALQMADDAIGIKNVQKQIERLIISYIYFAIEHKSLFQLMFSRELSEMKNYPTLAMTAGKNYSLISTALSRRKNSKEDTRFLTVAIWSLCHGLTSLIIDEKIDIHQFGSENIDEFIERVVNIFSDSL